MPRALAEPWSLQRSRRAGTLALSSPSQPGDDVVLPSGNWELPHAAGSTRAALPVAPPTAELRGWARPEQSCHLLLHELVQLLRLWSVHAATTGWHDPDRVDGPIAVRMRRRVTAREEALRS